MNILVLNAGTATLKCRVVATDEDRISNDGDVKLAHGLIERIIALHLGKVCSACAIVNGLELPS